MIDPPCEVQTKANKRKAQFVMSEWLEESFGIYRCLLKLVCFSGFLVIGLFFIVWCFFCFLFFFPFLIFFCWGNLNYFFGCDVISYGLVLLSLWICVLMVLARESVFRSGYFSGLFLFAVEIKFWSPVGCQPGKLPSGQGFYIRETYRN